MNMKKKILFLIPNLASGGAERSLVNLANNLNQTKFDITVQTLFDTGDNRQYLKKSIRYIPGWKHVFRGNTHILKIFTPEFLFNRLVKEKYDVIISYLEGITSRIIAGCHDRATKKVAWIHTGMISSSVAMRGFRSLKEANKCYCSYNKLVMVSQDVEKCFEKYFPATNTCILYNVNETDIIKEKSLDTLDPGCLSNNSMRICSVGRLIAVKGFDRLLNVHKRLIDEGIYHTIYIIGNGEEENRLKKKVHIFGVENTFVLIGFKDNPYKYIKNCDFYVCSSRREGFSTAVTESLIIGTPVISTDCSGARELLGENNEYGIVVENSEEGIYKGMKKMLLETCLRNSYRKKALIRGKRFSREETVTAVERMLESL